MKITTTILAACLCVTLVNSLPLNSGFQSQALDRLMVDETVNDSAFRSKRTIGILRQLFPDLSKMIEDKVNAIVGEIIKIFGPVVFNSILGGNKNGGGGTDASKSTGSTVDAKNPFDDDDTMSFTDDDDWFNSPPQSDDAGSKISLDLPTVKSTDVPTSTATSVKVEEPSSTSARPAVQESNTTSSKEEELTTLADDNATNSVL